MTDPLYPIYLKLGGRPVVVVGGGRVGLQKVRGLLRCGARVTVIAPEIVPELAAMVEADEVRWLEASFADEHLEGASLVIAATSERGVNRRVRAAAHARGSWINVADDPDLCDFYLASVLRRGPLAVAISTSGASPAYARRLRGDLESRIGPEVGRLLELVAEAREAIARRFPGDEERRLELNRRLLDTDALQHLAHGDEEAARAALWAIVGGSTT